MYGCQNEDVSPLRDGSVIGLFFFSALTAAISVLTPLPRSSTLADIRRHSFYVFELYYIAVTLTNGSLLPCKPKL